MKLSELKNKEIATKVAALIADTKKTNGGFVGTSTAKEEINNEVEIFENNAYTLVVITNCFAVVFEDSKKIDEYETKEDVDSIVNEFKNI